MRRQWTEADLDTIRAHYADKPTSDVAAMLGCSVAAVYNQAFRLGIKKSQAFYEGGNSSRIQRGHQNERMMVTRFKPGHVSWNKGVPRSTGLHPNSRATQFRPGRAPSEARNYLPVGSVRVIRQPFAVLERKTTDDPHIKPARRWVPVHRLVWIAANGPVPDGHIVVFKHGMRTLAEEEITLDKLACITRAENARRNDLGAKNPELKGLYQLKGAITRQINRITKEHTAS
ncbi:MAG: HNH endonuclease [Acidovorax sp.]|nr:HNH endonuclease [Acidovorax sp.]